MSIRKALPGDEKALAALHGAIFAQGWSAQSFDAFLRDAAILVLSHGAPADGFIVLRMAAGEAEILTLGVLPSARGKGLAKALVRAAAGHAAARNCKDLYLEVGIENKAARALYEGLGFVQVGRRNAYYPRPGQPAEDALVLKCAPSDLGNAHGFD
ncbi:MAG: GNAT family N-acetyltransferase [Alphaproteobacteria bacterium]|nr:GNAT family N-acetyltransferase [Alphaproteobacteria bacterium]